MTKSQYVEALRRVLGDEVVTVLMNGRLTLPAITDVAVKELFLRKECNTPDAEIIRKHRLMLVNPGHFTWDPEPPQTRCADGCTYSRAMLQPNPRLCVHCKTPEPPRAPTCPRCPHTLVQHTASGCTVCSCKHDPEPIHPNR